jgi:hypothetical protein
VAAPSGIVAVMQRNPNTPRRRQSATARLALELPPDRAFVLHLDARAQPPRRVIGRVEHVTSGRVTHITSLQELMTFLAEVLHQHAGRE